MYERNIPIKELRQINFSIDKIPDDVRCHMHEWYDEMIHKTYEQLSIFDVTRMIIQKEILDVALDRAIDYISENPLAGQRYDGELLEIISNLPEEEYEKRIPDIKQILLGIKPKIKTLEWICKEQSEEYRDVVNNFLEKIDKV